MKKLSFICVAMSLWFIFNARSWAETSTITWPTTAQNSYLNGQVILEIINHGQFFQEYRAGQKQMILADDVAELGHLKGQYIGAVIACVYQNPLKTNLDYEGKARVNLNPLVNAYVNMTPEWQTFLGNLEYGPTVGYDFGQPQSHAWIATFDLGLGFGPGSGIPTPQ